MPTPWFSHLKRTGLRLFVWSGLPALARRLSGRRTTIFMLHRFAEAGSEWEGDDPAALRRDLEYLHRNGYRLLSLEDALRRHATAKGPADAGVCFTVDDGYHDFARLAAPVFAAYDCPVTVFLTTGFLDGETWPWWDQLEHAFRMTSHQRLALGSSNAWHAVFTWEDEAGKQRALNHIVEHCKTIPDREKSELIGDVAGRLEVSLPDLPPTAYRLLTWDQVRELGRTGPFRFGPHTVTHPILSRVSDEEARNEILQSRARIEAETSATSPVFCYPNGDPTSFGIREIRILEECGFLGAVTSVHGYLSDGALAEPRAAYALPRFPYPGDTARLVEAASGLRRFRPGFRRERERRSPSPGFDTPDRR